MQLLAVVIAAALAAVALTPLARSHFRQPTLWVLVVIGVFAFPIAQWVIRTAWDPLAFGLGLPQGGAGLLVNMFAWALIAEGFKIAPVLIVGAMTEASPRDWFAYGAAAGAGYGLFFSQQLIAGSLEVSRLGTLTTPLSVTVAIALKLFPILSHAATTAFVGWATARGWLGRGLLIATLAQVLLSYIERGKGSLGTLGEVLFALVALFLFLYAWSLRDQPVRRSSRLSAR